MLIMVSVRPLSLFPRLWVDLAVRPHLRINSNQPRRLHCDGAADSDRGNSGRTPAAWRGLQRARPHFGLASFS